MWVPKIISKLVHQCLIVLELPHWINTDKLESKTPNWSVKLSAISLPFWIRLSKSAMPELKSLTSLKGYLYAVNKVVALLADWCHVKAKLSSTTPVIGSENLDELGRLTSLLEKFCLKTHASMSLFQELNIRATLGDFSLPEFLKFLYCTLQAIVFWM